jgi:hypothetical protein
VNQVMQTVFVVQHSYEDGEHEETKFIGVYASVADAEQAVARMRELPGFRHHRYGFTINACVVGQDHWTDGFVSLVTIMVPMADTSIQGWRPMEAEVLPGDQYLIVSGNAESNERLAFSVGQLVRCEERMVGGERCLVAVSSAMDPESGAQ